MTTKHIAVLGAGISGAIAARTLRDRGFAVTLAVGLVSNLFTATFVSKTLFELALSRHRQVATLSI